MNYFVLAQILGGIGAIAMIFSTWQKTRKKMFVFLIFDNLFYFLQYIVLKAYCGAFTNIVGLIRLAIFGKKNTSEFYRTKHPLYIVITLYIIIGIFTYNGILSLFPTIASIIYAIVLWQDQPSNIRKGTAFMLTLWLMYNIAVKAYVGALTEGILLISTIFAIIKIDLLKKGEIRC